MTDYYIKKADNEPLVRIDVDLALGEEDASDFRPMLLWLFIKMHAPDSSGLCRDPECGIFVEMRRALSEVLANELGAVFSGSRICEGWCEFYFYARSGKGLINAAGTALKRFEGYTFESGSSRDESWEHYRNELYPDVLMLHQIQNRHIIRELQEAGDDPALKREVEHYLFFRLPAHRTRAVDRLETAGFVCNETMEQEGDYAYGALLIKYQDVRETTMMETVEIILEIVTAEHGTYEGWSTTMADQMKV